MNLNVTTGTNPIDSAVRTYGALQGIRLADEEVAMKKQGMANEQSNREAMLKIAQEDSALRQTQGQQAATKFGWEQGDRASADMVNKLRPIQQKLAQVGAMQHKGQAVDPYDVMSKEEIDFVLSTPEGKDFTQNMNLVSEKMQNIQAFQQAAQAGDGVAAAKVALKIWPEQFNRGSDKFNPGIDIKQVGLKWQDPSLGIPGAVKVGPDGMVIRQGQPGYEQAQVVQLGKRPTSFKLDESHQNYAVAVEVTTVTPEGKVVTYPSTITEGRQPGTPEAWKPVQPLVQDLMVQQGLASIAQRVALGTGDKSAVALQDQEAQFRQSEALKGETVVGQATNLDAQNKINSSKADQYVMALTQNNPKIDTAGAMTLAAKMKGDPSWAEFNSDPALQAAVRAKLDARDTGELAKDKTKSEIEVHKSTARKNDAETQAIQTYKAEAARAKQVAAKFKDSPKGILLAQVNEELKTAEKAMSDAQGHALTAGNFNSTMLDKDIRSNINKEATYSSGRVQELRDRQKRLSDELEAEQRGGSTAPTAKQDTSALQGVVLGAGVPQASSPGDQYLADLNKSKK